jgi:hypothetical protein
MLYRLTILCLALVASAATVLAGDDIPAWLQQAAAQKAPAYERSVPAVVLLKEANVTVNDDGRIVTTTTYAVRILTREGRREAVAREVYLTDAGKVREMKAWLIRPDGSFKRYGKDETADVAGAMNDVYNEYRVKLILAEQDADAGSVFGYQVTSEDSSVFTQFDWDFQDNLPTLSSRYTLALPAGWRASSVVFNHPKIEPAVSGSSYTWELRNLAFIEDEPGSPRLSTLVPRLAVNYYPATGARIPGRTFETWADVARWLNELEAPQATVDEALSAKARSLTAGAKTELEKIQAIGHYVQNIRYISIQTGIGRGGGYRPHSATEVFAKAYGDCKDKASLMSAMLKVVGIDSYLVSIYSGDPGYVREEWPSPQQFNHCIIAVKVSGETKAASVIENAALGRLLIFDATDDNTPVGDLPDHEQGSFALIDAKDAGALLRMPVTPPEANRLERQAEVTLTPEGAITATVRERSIGQSAVDERRLFRRLSRPEYNTMIEAWITRGAAGAKLSKVEPTDSSSEGRFALDVEFTAGSYAQLMQQRLLVFKPAIVSRRESLFLTKQSRTHPVVLDSHAYTETVRIKLPDGFEVDELPDALKLDTAFGTYASTYEIKDGQLIFTRALTQRATTIPADQYTTVRNFYERIRAAEQAPVVLAKK